MIGTNLAITPKSYFRGLSLDPDAQIYISAANITDTTQQSAVNQLVLDLKSIGVWTKEKALYPVLGGSASSHAVNLKQPGTFNLTFATGWTHSNNGILPNGATYANTNLIPASLPLVINNTSLSIYSRTSLNLGNFDMGQLYVNGVSQSYHISLGVGRSLDNNTVSYLYNSDANRIIFSQNNASGMFVSSRTSSSVFKLFQNSVLKSSNSTVNSSVFQGLGLNSILVGAINYYDFNGVPQNQIVSYSQKQYSFASIGDGLTDTEALNKTVAVQKYQRALGRAVDMEIQVGTGATRSYYTPFSTMDNYSISGNIYLQSEVISAAIPMLGIEMYFSGFTLPYTMTNQEIYLAHVSQSQFDSAPAVDFSDLTLSNLTLVKASFTFTAANNAWVRMNFDTPFQYNGTSNILVIWKNNKGTWTSGGGGTDTHVSTSRSMYKVGSTGQPTGNGTLTNNRSNIKFIW